MGNIGARDVNDSPQGAAAIAIGSPDFDDVSNMLATNTNVGNHFAVGGSSDVLGYIDISSGFSVFQNADTQVLRNEIAFTIDTTELDSEQNLLLGLLDTTVGTNGFESVRFLMTVEFTAVIDETFTSILEATDYFDDQIIDLGLWSDDVSADGLLNVGFTLDTLTPLAEMGFRFNGILGNSTINSTVVPLPAAIWLLLSAILILPRRGNPSTETHPAI